MGKIVPQWPVEQRRHISSDVAPCHPCSAALTSPVSSGLWSCALQALCRRLYLQGILWLPVLARPVEVVQMKAGKKVRCRSQMAGGGLPCSSMRTSFSCLRRYVLAWTRKFCLFYFLHKSICFHFLQGILRDGCKIVIFNGTFDIKSDSSGKGGEQTRLQLTCNGTRIAGPRARLGFVQPSALLRGISLKSITPGMLNLHYINLKLFY